MRYLIFALLSVYAGSCSSQVYPNMVQIPSNQNPDTSNIGVFYPSGYGSRTGRMHVVSYETLADTLRQYLPDTNLFSHNLTLLSDREHNGGGYDFFLNDMGEFKVESDQSGKYIWLEHSNAGGTPINTLKITDDDIQLNADDGAITSSLTMGDAISFSNSNGSYLFENIFSPIPSDNTLTTAIAINSGGYLRQTNLNAVHLTGNETIAGIKTLSSPLVISGYTVATLPTGVLGMTAYVTDASAPTYLSIVAGGGAVVCPVFFNGTNWVCH